MVLFLLGLGPRSRFCPIESFPWCWWPLAPLWLSVEFPPSSSRALSLVSVAHWQSEAENKKSPKYSEPLTPLLSLHAIGTEEKALPQDCTTKTDQSSQHVVLNLVLILTNQTPNHSSWCQCAVKSRRSVCGSDKTTRFTTSYPAAIFLTELFLLLSFPSAEWCYTDYILW